MLKQLLDVAALARAIVGRVAHEDGDAVVEQPALQRLDDRKGEPAEAVVGENADRHRARAMQALREAVGAVADVLRDLQDLGARFRAQAAIGVQRLGGRADGDACEASDVANGLRAVGRALFAGCDRVADEVAHLTAPDSRPET